MLGPHSPSRHPSRSSCGRRRACMKYASSRFSQLEILLASSSSTRSRTLIACARAAGHAALGGRACRAWVLGMHGPCAAARCFYQLCLRHVSAQRDARAWCWLTTRANPQESAVTTHVIAQRSHQHAAIAWSLMPECRRSLWRARPKSAYYRCDELHQAHLHQRRQLGAEGAAAPP